MQNCREGAFERFDAEARRPAVSLSNICCRQRGLIGPAFPAPMAANGVQAMWRVFISLRRDGRSNATGVRKIIRRKPKLKTISLLLVLSCFFGFLNLFGKSNVCLSGSVFDAESGTPVVDARIDLFATGYGAVSNEYGEFKFENIPAGSYKAIVSADGYAGQSVAEIKIVDDIPQRHDFRLKPKIYHLGTISVREKRLEQRSDNVEVLMRHQIEQSGARDLGDLLANISGVQIQRGSSSAATRVKIRGSDPKQVLILLDGQKINNSSDGVADISFIPLDIVERLELFKGGASAEFGPDALGGVINIITRAPRLHENTKLNLSVSGGRWNSRKYQLLGENLIHIKHLSTRFVYNQRESDGDFDFNYSSYPDLRSYSGTRKNNFSEAKSYLLNGGYDLSEKADLFWSTQYYRKEAGLPDRASRQNEIARSLDRRLVLSTGLTYLFSPDNKAEVDFNFSQYRQHYFDRESVTGFDSRYTNDLFSIRARHNLILIRDNHFRYGVEFKRDILYHSDLLRPSQSMGRTIRDNSALFIHDEYRFDISSILLADNLVLTGSLRYDYINTRSDSTAPVDTVNSRRENIISPKAGLVISKGESLAYFIRASYGKSTRLPSINALFWVGDARSSGNPDLRPEKSEHSELGLELKAVRNIFNISGGITYFHSFIGDLVVWQPSVNVWRPVNLDKAQITGIENFISLALFEDKISARFQNNRTTALNKSPGHTSYNKRLVFSPDYVRTLEMKMDYMFLNASYNIRWVDSVFTLEANTKYYKDYRLDDLKIGAELKIARMWKLQFDYRLNNVRDVDYVLMTHYPMPGREWEFGFTISYGLNENAHIKNRKNTGE